MLCCASLVRFLLEDSTELPSEAKRISKGVLSMATLVANRRPAKLLEVDERLRLEAEKAQLEADLRAFPGQRYRLQPQLTAIVDKLDAHYRAKAQLAIAQATTG